MSNRTKGIIKHITQGSFLPQPNKWLKRLTSLHSQRQSRKTVSQIYGGKCCIYIENDKHSTSNQT